MAGPFDNLDPSFSSRLQAFIAASNGLVRSGSGFRTNEEQAQLYNRYRAGVPGQARAAPPGHSMHNFGLAMDLQYGAGGQEWAHQNAARFGLYFPMSDEPWHIQMTGADMPEDGQTPAQGLVSAGIDPKDEIASRIQQVMGMLVGQNPSAETPSDLLEAGVEPNPINDRYLGTMFSNTNGHMGATPKITAGGDAGQLQQYALSKFQQFGWGQDELDALVELWNRESNWNPAADNPTSTAAGIAQKLQSVHGAVEPTGEGQIDWGLQYIVGRYGSPSRALAFHDQHNWY